MKNKFVAEIVSKGAQKFEERDNNKCTSKITSFKKPSIHTSECSAWNVIPFAIIIRHFFHVFAATCN